MKLTHGRNAEEIARANTAILIELIKRLQAKGVLTADEAQVMLEDAALPLWPTREPRPSPAFKEPQSLRTR